MNYDNNKMKKLSTELSRLESELENLSARCEAYECAFEFADVMAEVAKHAYWGSRGSKEKIQELLNHYGRGDSLWGNWECIKKRHKVWRCHEENYFFQAKPAHYVPQINIEAL